MDKNMIAQCFKGQEKKEGKKKGTSLMVVGSNGQTALM